MFILQYYELKIQYFDEKCNYLCRRVSTSDL